MAGVKKYPGQPIFGLDIGTRSVVGTVGYRNQDSFFVMAQETKMHETRAMLDGQIHDIAKVSETITEVCDALEEKLHMKPEEVCIAAAGRVLKTQNAHVKMEFDRDTVVTAEELFALTSLGVEKAFAQFQQAEETEEKFYCVGHSVIRYYINGNIIGNPEGHKARTMEADLIATFLPDDVVDGLYRAVEGAGLRVANLTLEPIAAIQVAIPEKFRMLNIALVDVGAGTSDICITKDGSIVAYGMIPCAGDSLTELIAQHCLVEFAVAEQIKLDIADKEEVTYEDIMCLKQTITREEVLRILESQIADLAQKAADCIMKANGDKPVSAVFVVGGGGKIAGYTKQLANALGIEETRVALRGEEVMHQINFPPEIKKDALLVTPIGICLNFYEQNNNFVFVNFNEERIKLYDNNHLAVVDAAMQANYPTDALFPKRGKELNYYVNQKARITRGELGESAQISVNREPADINTPIHANDIILICEATAGAPARETIEHLPEFKAFITLDINGKKIKLPKFATVNRKLQPGSYEIKEGDRIEFLDYYTMGQILKFMDMEELKDAKLLVNHEVANLRTRVYENFSVSITTGKIEKGTKKAKMAPARVGRPSKKRVNADAVLQPAEHIEPIPETIEEPKVELPTSDAIIMEELREVTVIVNKAPVTLKGKSAYVFVDVFDYISFDLTKSDGRTIMTKLNGRNAQYMENLNQGDVLDIYWE